MLLKNVNLKYPATIALSSAMDASNEPDIEMQKAFEAKNKAVNEPIDEDENKLAEWLQHKNDIIKWIQSKDYCNKHFELTSFVKNTFQIYGLDFDTNMKKFEDKYTNEYIKQNYILFDQLYYALWNIYSGEMFCESNYTTSNAEWTADNIAQFGYDTHMPEQYKGLQMRNNSELRQLVDFSTHGDVATSFRTRLIAYVIEKYNDLLNNIADVELQNFYKDFKNKIQQTIGKHTPMAKSYKTFNIETKLVQLTNYEIIQLYDNILIGFITTYDLVEPTYKIVKPASKTSYRVVQPNDDIYNTIVEEKKVGHGLKPSEKIVHRKYFIDTHKLNNNVLEVRYNKNRHLTNVKTQVIGHGVKNIIHSIINNDDMNQNEYHVLTEQEKHLIRTILNMLDKSHLLSNADEEFNERFQILLSEYNAGNNSEILRNQIKQYILHAMKLNMIGRQAGQQMIIEMCF
jgi:hypothetical protein